MIQSMAHNMSLYLDGLSLSEHTWSRLAFCIFVLTHEITVTLSSLYQTFGFLVPVFNFEQLDNPWLDWPCDLYRFSRNIYMPRLALFPNPPVCFVYITTGAEGGTKRVFACTHDCLIQQTTPYSSWKQHPTLRIACCRFVNVQRPRAG